MRRKKHIKNFIIYMIVICVVLGMNASVVYADKTISGKSMNGTQSIDPIMQYNARPEIRDAFWIGKGRDQIGLDFSEEMSVTGKYSVLNPANYEISSDGGKTWILLSKIGVQRIETVDEGSKVIITMMGNAPSSTLKQDMIRVAEVSDTEDKRILNSPVSIKLKKHEMDLSRVKKIVAVAPNKLTIETDFRIMKLNPWSLESTVAGNKGICKAEFKNNNTGSLITVYLDKNQMLLPNIENVESLTINPGGITDFFGATNENAVEFGKKDISDGIEPTIQLAETMDTDHDGRVDGVKVTYDEPIKIIGSSETAIQVDGYEVKKLSTKGKILTITLNERKQCDTGNTPFIQFYGVISDIAGNIPVEDTDGVRVSDGAAPVLIGAEIVSQGKKSGFGNDQGDALSLRFSEPIISHFQNAKYPEFIELYRLLDCIDDGKSKDVFVDGKFEARDLSVYPANELTIIIGSKAMGSVLRKGDLLRVKPIGLIKDVAGLEVFDSKTYIRIK